MKKTIILVLAIAFIITGSLLAYKKLGAIDKSKQDLAERDDIDIGDTDNIALDIDYNADNGDTARNESNADVQTSAVEPSSKGYGDFYVYDYNDEQIYLSSKVDSGKPVIINFWTTWCGYCKSEMPDFNDKYLEYGDRIEFMMVDINGGGNDNIDKAKKYIEESGFEFPVYFDTDLKALSTYYTDGFPATIVIDADGNVVYARSGMLTEAQLQSIIDQII